MWERAGFFGMLVLLPLSLAAPTANGGFGWSNGEAIGFVGTYLAGVSLSPLLAGVLMHRRLSSAYGLMLGGVAMLAGHLLLALVPWFSASSDPTDVLRLWPADGTAWRLDMLTFYIGVMALVLGSGFFIVAAPTLAGRLIATDDARRPAAFSLFYALINVGYLIGTLLVGYVGETQGWHRGYAAAAAVMACGLVFLLPVLRGWPARTVDSDEAQPQASLVAAWRALTPEIRKRLLVLLLLSLAVQPFYLVYGQIYGFLQIEIFEHTRREVFGFVLPAAWLQATSGLLVIAYAPLFAWLWTRSVRSGRQPKLALQLAAAVLLAALALVPVLAGLMERTGRVDGTSALHWVPLCYAILVAGEMCVGPVMLAAITCIAPSRWVGPALGVWFLAGAGASKISGMVGAMAADGQAVLVMGALAALTLAWGLGLAVIGRRITL